MRTLAELEDDLAQELAWRRTELHSLLSEIRTARGPSLSCLCRAGVALLYAHWEGYTKHALSQYLRYVARRRLTLRELHDCFVAMALNARIAKTQGLSAMGQSMEIVTTIRDHSHERLFIPSRDAVDTQSNLSSVVCFEIFACLGLDSRPFDTKRALIDYSLLMSRNRIAHGEYLDITLGGYVELHHEVIGMLETIMRIVVSAAEDKSYLRAS
jgi:MAE_28990/MAE_18760-like HEPN